MVMFVNWQVRRTAEPGQGARLRWTHAALTAALLLGLGGCESIEQFYTTRLPVDVPIDWWHQLQGGMIAEERPPAPGADDPYPNMADVPARPVPTDANTRRTLTARLAAERDRSERAAAQDPIVPPGRGVAAAAPATPAVPAPPPMARIDAAEAPAAPRAAVAPPPGPPAPAAIQAAAAATPPSRQPGANFVAGPVPALPVAAPALPTLAGIPAATAAPAVPRARPQVVAAFVPGSAVLRPESDAALRVLGVRRAGGDVAVLGGGDAGSADPAAQAAALPLAWRRARAMADALVAAGVPVAAMRIDAAALARGGVVRLLE